MSGIRRVVVIKDNVLLLLTALNDLRRSGLQLVPNLVNQRNDEGGNDGKDKDGELLLQLLNDLGKDRDVFNGTANALHDAIVEFDNGHDLLVDLLDVDGELFGISGRNGLGFLLGGSRIVLNLVKLFSLVVIAQDARGQVVEQVLEQASIAGLAFVEGSLKFVNFILSQLVRY